MAMIRDGSGHITSQPQCSAAVAKVNDTWSTVCDRFTKQVLTGVVRSWLLRSCHTRLREHQAPDTPFILPFVHLGWGERRGLDPAEMSHPELIVGNRRAG